VGTHFVRMAGMTSQHDQPQRSWRPDPDEYQTAKSLLGDRGQSITAYLRACLRWLDHEPDVALDTLAPHWPGPRRIGRPRHQDGDHDSNLPDQNGAGAAPASAPVQTEGTKA
jgi:hypothetical protein